MSTSAGELYDTGMGHGPEEARQALNLPWAAVMNLFQQNRDLNSSLQVPEQESAFNFYLKAFLSAAEWLRQGDVPAGLSLWWRWTSPAASQGRRRRFSLREENEGKKEEKEKEE